MTIDKILNDRDFLSYAKNHLGKSYADLMLTKPIKLESLYEEYKSQK